MSAHGATFDAFLTWMRQNGFTWRDEDLSFRVVNGTQAVLARRDLPADYSVCVMPKQGMLTIRTCAIASLLRKHKVKTTCLLRLLWVTRL